MSDIYLSVMVADERSLDNRVTNLCLNLIKDLNSMYELSNGFIGELEEISINQKNYLKKELTKETAEYLKSFSQSIRFNNNVKFSNNKELELCYSQLKHIYENDVLERHAILVLGNVEDLVKKSNEKSIRLENEKNLVEKICEIYSQAYEKYCPSHFGTCDFEEAEEVCDASKSALIDLFN